MVYIKINFKEFVQADTSTSLEQLKQYKSWVSNERWNELKKLAETAMKDRKVFMIKGGGFPAVRRALLERGWVEKYESHKVFVKNFFFMKYRNLWIFVIICN